MYVHSIKIIVHNHLPSTVIVSVAMATVINVTYITKPGYGFVTSSRRSLRREYSLVEYI